MVKEYVIKLDCGPRMGCMYLSELETKDKFGTKHALNVYSVKTFASSEEAQTFINSLDLTEKQRQNYTVEEYRP